MEYVDRQLGGKVVPQINSKYLNRYQIIKKQK